MWMENPEVLKHRPDETAIPAQLLTGWEQMLVDKLQNSKKVICASFYERILVHTGSHHERRACDRNLQLTSILLHELHNSC